MKPGALRGGVCGLAVAALTALSFDKPGTDLRGQAPRIIDPTMGLSQCQNGAFVPCDGGKFTNPFVVP